MKRLTKSTLLTLATALFAVMATLSLIFFAPVKTYAQTVTPETATFSIDTVQVRLGLDENNDFDYSKNGIKFIAKMDNTTYLAVKDTAVFGMLIMPYDYMTGGIFDEQNVTFTEGVAKYDAKTVAYGETAELTEDDGAWYMDGSIINQIEANKSRDFVAVPYLKTNGTDGVEYSFKPVSTEYNMVDLAKDVIANNTTISEPIKFSLRDAYGIGMAEDSVYASVAGNYTNTYVLNADKTVSITNLATYDNYGHNTQTTGTYVLYEDGGMKVTLGDETLYGSYDTANSKFTLNSVESVKVDMDRLDKILTLNNATLATKGGTGDPYKRYSTADYLMPFGNSIGFKISTQGLNFFSVMQTDSSTQKQFNCTLNGAGTRYMYKLIPITETFGKIDTTYVTRSGYDASNPDHVAESKQYENYTYGDLYYVVKNENEMHLRLSNNIVKTWKPITAHGHFIDLCAGDENGPTSPYDTTVDFEKLAGEGGTTDVPVSKTYTNGTASLVLKNDGVLKLSATIANKSYTFMGGKAVFNDGENEINATYNLIAISATNGKIFIDMAETPNWYGDAEDKTRYVVGDYTIDNGVITIEFAYGNVQYTLTCNA